MLLCLQKSFTYLVGLSYEKRSIFVTEFGEAMRRAEGTSPLEGQWVFFQAADCFCCSVGREG